MRQFIFAVMAAAVVLAVAGCGGGGDETTTHEISGAVGGAVSGGVTVTLTGTGGGLVAVGATDAGGRYRFRGIADGVYLVTPSRPGFVFVPASTLVTVHPGDATGQDFAATPAGSDAGIVQGTVQCSFATDVVVTLAGPVGATTVVGLWGTYRFEAVPPGGYTVTPSRSGFEFFPPTATVTVTGAGAVGADFTCSPTVWYAMSGQVTGATQAGVTLVLGGQGGATTVTDEAGRYAFDGWLEGYYTVTPSKPGFTFTPPTIELQLGPASVTGLDFVAVAVPTFSLTGVVTGASRAEVTIWTFGPGGVRTALTDASGRYALPGLEAGGYEVWPSKEGVLFSPPVRSVEIADQDATADFEALAPWVISGLVSGHAGPGVTITLSGAVSATAVTDERGAYWFAGLPNGAYTLTASLAGFLFEPGPAQVTVADGNLVVDFTAALDWVLSGTVTGATQEGVTVTLIGAAWGGAVQTTKTDAAGRYAFRGFFPGQYALWASKPGYTLMPQVLQAWVEGGDSTGNDFTAEAYAAGPFAAALQGLWSRCEVMSPGYSFRVTETYGGNNWYWACTTYASGDCSGRVMSLYDLVIGSLEIGDPVPAMLGARGPVTAHQANFSVGGVRYYDILYIDDAPDPDRLYEGDLPWSTTPEARPTALGETPYTERQP